MSVTSYGDFTLLDYKGYGFVWEPAWEMWRPVDGIRWNGTSFVLDDTLYCADPLDPYYGFGSAQMKRICELLESKRTSAIAVETPLLGGEDKTWFRDRFVSLTPCAPTDLASWKRLVKGKPRTCRRPPPGKKLTKRNRAYKKCEST